MANNHNSVMSLILSEVDSAKNRKMKVEGSSCSKEANREPFAPYKQLLSNHDKAILQLRKAELNHLRGVSSSTDEDTEDVNGDVSSNFGHLELDSTYAWSDCSDSSSISGQMDGDVHDSIEAIRVEASRIDTIMALDQLDTMKQELNSIKKELDTRRLEVQDLRELVALKDDLLCTMELERDLYKAEVAKLKDQMNATTSELGRLRAAEQPEATTVHVTTIHAVGESEPLVVVPEAHIEAIPSEGIELDSMLVQQMQVNEVRQQHQGIEPPRRSNRQSHQSVLDEIRGKEESRSCLFGSITLFRKKRRGRLEERDEYTRELGRLLRTSLDTSEELRRRIAVLSAYYENFVERMQCNLNRAYAERQRMATDLANQIVAMDKARRRAVDDLERRLRQKERELATARQVQL